MLILNTWHLQLGHHICTGPDLNCSDNLTPYCSWLMSLLTKYDALQSIAVTLSYCDSVWCTSIYCHDFIILCQMPQREISPMGLPFDWHLPPRPVPNKPPQSAFSLFRPTLARLSQRLSISTPLGSLRKQRGSNSLDLSSNSGQWHWGCPSVWPVRYTEIEWWACHNDSESAWWLQ